jgi:eukaryotic-like serine/threonine-protein kinase
MMVDVGAHAAAGDDAHNVSPYRTLITLARGGMGQVDLCVRRSGSFERLYAVKRLHPHLREEQTMRSMFVDEARVAGLVRHANVVSVLDVGEDAEGPYLVMDYIEGIPLSRFVKERARLGAPLPIPVCAQIVAQVARGLHAAHELTSAQGTPLELVHRDVSPQNILVGRDGVVRVTDFGIAKALGRSTHTSTGILKGKLGYMSPEQLSFERVDRRTDLFSLGVVLFELVHLRRLYKGEDASEVARRILHDEPPDLAEHRADVPPVLVELAFELLAKQQEHRPATALEVAERLEELSAAYGEVVDVGEEVDACLGPELHEQSERIRSLAEAEGTRATASSTVPAAAPSDEGVVPRGRGQRWLVAGLLAVFGVGGYALFFGGGRSSSEEPVAEATTVVHTQAETVTLRVQSDPVSATIELGATIMGDTPLSIDVARGGDPLVVLVKLEGYTPAEYAVVPDRDQSIFVALTPEVEPGGETTSDLDQESTATQRSAPRTRRRRAAPTSKRTEESSRPQFRKFD